MPNYGPKAFLCMTTSTLFVESIANRSGRSLFFAIVRVLLQILLHILLTSFFDQVGEEMRERRGTYRWDYYCGPKVIRKNTDSLKTYFSSEVYSELFSNRDEK